MYVMYVVFSDVLSAVYYNNDGGSHYNVGLRGRACGVRVIAL